MVAGLSTGALVVFALIGVALVAFVTEWLPPDVTAIGVLVSLAVLEPHTGVDSTAAIQGFASPAVVTIIAMYVLSAGVERTGVVDYLGAVLADVTGGDEGRLLAATVGTTGLSAGFVNNTPVVAVFIPMVTDLSDRAGISPSKLLMPLSFAAMLGGTLTLVGTATTLLASDLAADLGYHRFSMFEITPVGALVLLVGLAYLLTIGRRLVPERIPPALPIVDQYDLDRHLSVLVVREGSPLVGHRVGETPAPPAVEAATDSRPATDTLHPAEAEAGSDAVDGEATEERSVGKPVDGAVEDPVDGAVGDPADDVEVIQLERDGEAFVASASDEPIAPGDRLTVRGSLQAVNGFAERYDLAQRSREVVGDEDLVQAPHDAILVEAVVHPESRVVGQRIGDLELRDRFDTTVLAVRTDGRLVRENIDEVTLERGDSLLLQTEAAPADYFEEAGYFVVTERVVEVDDEGTATASDAIDRPTFAGGPELTGSDTGPDEVVDRPDVDPRAPLAVGVLLSVVVLAALDLVSVTIAALGGVVVLVASGTITSNQAYDAVNWSVVFLLAGLLPLGVAMQSTGGAEFVASALVAAGDYLPVLGVLALVYLVTAVVAAVITPVATVVLLVPVAVETATQLGADGFPFLVVVTFAAANAFLTPIGYQTNLMVYGPGGYRFTDYARVGAPLQLLLTVVTTLGVAALWPP